MDQTPKWTKILKMPFFNILHFFATKELRHNRIHSERLGSVLEADGRTGAR
jgi:hypothetical protein